MDNSYKESILALIFADIITDAVGWRNINNLRIILIRLWLKQKKPNQKPCTIM